MQNDTPLHGIAAGLKLSPGLFIICDYNNHTPDSLSTEKGHTYTVKPCVYLFFLFQSMDIATVAIIHYVLLCRMVVTILGLLQADYLSNLKISVSF